MFLKKKLRRAYQTVTPDLMPSLMEHCPKPSEEPGEPVIVKKTSRLREFVATAAAIALVIGMSGGLAWFLLSGKVPGTAPTEPTQTDPIPTVIEHYFYADSCWCVNSPGIRYRDYPNYFYYTDEFWHPILDELKDKSVTLNGTELIYARSEGYSVRESANHPASEKVLFDVYEASGVTAKYFHGTDVLFYYNRYGSAIKTDENAMQKSESELQALAEAFVKENIPEVVLSEFTFVEFGKSSSDDNDYDLRYKMVFPQTQNEDIIHLSIDIYGNITSFKGPSLHFLDVNTGKIRVTEEMKEAAYASALKFIEELGLVNVEILETNYGFKPSGIMYLNITIEHDLTMPDDAFPEKPEEPIIERHKETWYVNVN